MDTAESSSESSENTNSDLPMAREKEAASSDLVNAGTSTPTSQEETKEEAQGSGENTIIFAKPSDNTGLTALDVKSTTSQEMPPTPPPSEIFEDSQKQTQPAPAIKYRVLCQCGAKVCRGYLYWHLKRLTSQWGIYSVIETFEVLQNV